LRLPLFERSETVRAFEVVDDFEAVVFDAGSSEERSVAFTTV
jgi:hypothetical protein